MLHFFGSILNNICFDAAVKSLKEELNRKQILKLDIKRHAQNFISD